MRAQPEQAARLTEYSIGDVADRAGVANDDVVMLVELGILSSGPDGHFSQGDVRRVRLMQTLERAGMPLQEVAAAVQSGNLSLGFLDTAAYDRLASLSEVTFQEVSGKTGIPVDLLMVIREAVGFAEPSRRIASARTSSRSSRWSRHRSEHPRRDRGDPVTGGRLQPPGAAPGHLLPRHHGLHPAHRGAWRRSRGRARRHTVADGAMFLRRDRSGRAEGGLRRPSPPYHPPRHVIGSG
jgi:DNA-binding transcriptional MerR regulator